MANNTSNQLTVLIIVNRLFEWSQNFITRELAELNTQGINMYIATREITHRKDLTPSELALKQKAIILPENPFTPYALFLHLRTAIRSPKNYIAAWKTLFSLGHRHPSKFFRSMICLFRATAIAHIVQQKGINLIHAHFLTAPGETAAHLSALTGIPYGGTGHAMDIYKDNSGLKAKIAGATYITTCTAANETYLKTSGIADPKKIVKLYHGIPLHNHIPGNEPPLPFTFLAVGRLVQKKGYKYLIQACHILQQKGFDFRCVFVGKGPLEENLQKQVAESKLSDFIHFSGFVPPNQMSDIYQNSHALVAPSIIDEEGDKDGLPNVCLEAMNNGLPIIGSNISGIPEGVFDGKNGLLVPPADPEALCSAMENIMTSPNRKEMKKAARKIASENFSLKTNIHSLANLMTKHYKRP